MAADLQRSSLQYSSDDSAETIPIHESHTVNSRLPSEAGKWWSPPIPASRVVAGQTTSLPCVLPCCWVRLKGRPGALNVVFTCDVFNLQRLTGGSHIVY